MTTLPLVIKDVAPLPTIDETLGYLKGITKEDALLAVKSLAHRESEDWFHVGMLLSAYRSTKSEGEWADLLSYADDNFRINKRKAYYLIGIYDSLVSSGITYSQVQAIGWTKLKEITPLLTTENVDYWVDVATATTTRNLIALLKSKATADHATGAALDAQLETFEIPPSTTLKTSFAVDTGGSKDIEPAQITVLEVSSSDGGVSTVTVSSEIENDAVEVFDVAVEEDSKIREDVLFTLSEMLSKYTPENIIKLVSELFPHFKIVSSPL